MLSRPRAHLVGSSRKLVSGSYIYSRSCPGLHLSAVCFSVCPAPQSEQPSGLLSLATPSIPPISSVLPVHHPHRLHRRPLVRSRSSRQTSGRCALAQPPLIEKKEPEALQTAIEEAWRSQGVCRIDGCGRLSDSGLRSGGVMVSRACLSCLAHDIKLACQRIGCIPNTARAATLRCCTLWDFNNPLHIIGIPPH